MDIDNIVNKIIIMPRSFNNSKNVSIYELLKETGYFEVYDKISEKLIYHKLFEFKEFVNEWLVYSEDKRTNSGYYIKQDRDKCIVGYFNKNGNSKKKEYMDKIEACASYIKNEIEEIRNLG